MNLLPGQTAGILINQMHLFTGNKDKETPVAINKT
jgi:hypothetical protein